MRDRPMLGIALMLAFCITVPLADAMAKILGGRTPLLQLVLVRFLFQVAILTPIALALRQPMWWSRRVTGLVALRGALQIGGISLMFLSLRHLPLAEAVAIAFVMPFILLVLGRLFLNEEVGIRRIAAAILGFAGTLCVVQPSFAQVGWAALYPMGVAVIFAVFMLLTRHVARITDPVALQATTGLSALILLAPLAGIGLAAGHLPWDIRLIPPGDGDLWRYLALGGLGTAGHLLLSWSLRFAPASTLAPMQYLEIPCAALIGWMIFDDFPNGLALLGIAITIAAGLYVIWRERIGGAPRDKPPAPPAA